jgi:hypothetical protein
MIVSGSDAKVTSIPGSGFLHWGHMAGANSFATLAGFLLGANVTQNPHFAQITTTFSTYTCAILSPPDILDLTLLLIIIYPWVPF